MDDYWSVFHTLDDNWVLMGSECNNNNNSININNNQQQELTIIGHGSNGITELKSHLKSDMIAFAILKLAEGNNKLMFLTWAGPNVSAIRRVKSHEIKKQLLKLLNTHFHVEQVAYKIDEISHVATKML